MKKKLFPMLIATTLLFSGCKWFSGKPTQERIKELKDQLAQLKTEIKEMSQKKKQNPKLTHLQTEINKKAEIANTKIATVVQSSEELLELNKQIIEKRSKLSDETISPEEKEKIKKESTALILQFKSSPSYKAEIEPLELAIKDLAQEYQQVAAIENLEIQKLIDKKQELFRELKQAEALA